MKTFTPILNILPPEQTALWYRLSSTPLEFILYGGTAIALRLGHRQSVDFDFFSELPFEPRDLYQTIPYLQGSKVIQRAKNTLSCLVKTNPGDKAVKVSFLGKLPLKHILKPDRAADNNLKVASLIDLLGMKCATVVDRVEKKDYIDIHAILQQSPLTLEDGLKAARIIYRDLYNPIITLKALSYFEGGDLGELDDTVKTELLSAVQGVNINKLMNRIFAKSKKKVKREIER